MKLGPHALSNDGSSDSGIEKMNPLTVCLFDTVNGIVTTQFLDMCMLFFCGGYFLEDARSSFEVQYSMDKLHWNRSCYTVKTIVIK